MSDSLEMLRRSAHAQQRTQVTVYADEAEESSCSCFGYLRGLRERALMIEFRLKNGNRQAFPYAWLGPMQYNPSSGLLLKFVGDLVYLVLIEGTNLDAPINDSTTLYERGILRQRVTWVREMTPQEVRKATQGEVTVERIQLFAHRHDEEIPDVDSLCTFRAVFHGGSAI